MRSCSDEPAAHVLFLEFGLVPHGIGHHAVEGLQVVALAELRFAKGVADLYLAFHIVNNHVHVRHRPGARLVLLTVEPGRGVLFFERRHIFSCNTSSHLISRPAEPQQRSYMSMPGSGSMICAITIPTPPGYRTPRALAAALSELADQVFVAASDNVGIHVVQAQTLGANRLYEVT